ncbi:MAG: hypothetical protein AAF740_05410 [Bacteroidota bacterium]
MKTYPKSFRTQWRRTTFPEIIGFDCFKIGVIALPAVVTSPDQQLKERYLSGNLFISNSLNCLKVLFLALFILSLTTLPSYAQRDSANFSVEFLKKLDIGTGTASPIPFTPELPIFTRPKNEKSSTVLEIPEFIPFNFPAISVAKTKRVQVLSENQNHLWYPHFVEFGFGNYLSPSLRAGSALLDRKLLLNADYRGNLQGEVDGGNSAAHHGSFFAQYNDTIPNSSRNKLARNHLQFSAGYQYQQNHFYGYQLPSDTLTVPDAADIRRQTHAASFLGSIQHLPEDFVRDKLEWRGELSGGYFLGDLEEQEWRAVGSVWFGQAAADDEIGWKLQAAARIDQFQDSLQSQTRMLGTLSPSIEQVLGRFSYRAGAHVSYLITDSANYDQSIFFYPDVRLSYHVFPQLLHVQLSGVGGMQANYYEKLYRQNPFLQAVNMGLRHTNELYRGQLDIKLTPTAAWTIQASGSYGNYDNLVTFRNSTIDSTQFELVFQERTISIVQGNLSVVYASPKIVAAGRFTMRRFSFEDQNFAWYVPLTEGSLTFDWTISDNWHFHQGLFYTGTRPAPLPGSLESITLDAIVNLETEVIFEPDNQLRIFARVSNALGQNYQQFLFYPELRRQFSAGLRYAMGRRKTLAR